MKSQSFALFGLFFPSAFAVPRTERHDGGNDQPISGAKGAPILGKPKKVSEGFKTESSLYGL
jgi:hypothetical protein